MARVVSEKLEHFLRARLTTADQIEIVLLLMKEPERSWTAPEVSSALRMPPESAAMRLFLLASGGLIVFEPSGVPRYKFAGGDDETKEILQELATAYESNRDAVRAIVGAGPSDPVRTFADAFKLKG